MDFNHSCSTVGSPVNGQWPLIFDIWLPNFCFQWWSWLVKYFLHSPTLWLVTVKESQWPSVREIQYKNLNETLCSLEESDSRGFGNRTCHVWKLYTSVCQMDMTSEMCGVGFNLLPRPIARPGIEGKARYFSGFQDIFLRASQTFSRGGRIFLGGGGACPPLPPFTTCLFNSPQLYLSYICRIKGTVRWKIFYLILILCRSTFHMRKNSVLTKSISHHVPEIFRFL